jgi:hypothetical protein
MEFADATPFGKLSVLIMAGCEKCQFERVARTGCVGEKIFADAQAFPKTEELP